MTQIERTAFLARSLMLDVVLRGIATAAIHHPHEIALMRRADVLALLDEMVNVVSGNRPSYERSNPDETPDEFLERISQGGGG